MNKYIKLVQETIEEMRTGDHPDFQEDVVNTMQVLAAAMFAISDAILYIDGRG